jgi:HTH-type transcriptional regulator/antitoxin HigA
MPRTKSADRNSLPRRFAELVGMMPPQAITDDVSYGNTLEMIDRLMAAGRLSSGQELYLRTLVQLVEAYEARHESIETGDLTGVEALKHLLAENTMSGADLGRLLGLHPSMGSKILSGERSLTVEHLRKLAARFRVSPELFIDRQLRPRPQARRVKGTA